MTLSASTITGALRKMKSELAEPVRYALPVGDDLVPLEDRLGATVRLRFDGEIRCVHCGRRTNKSFQQGYCFPCFRKLARCDSCQVKPELCHFHKGTCREPDWGTEHCMIPHTVYLANASGLKVGITRAYQRTTRWIDQGASQALAIRTTFSRLDSGRAEVALKALVADKTNWRKMLKGIPVPLDLLAQRDRILTALGKDIPGEAGEESVVEIRYPVLAYPEKVTSRSLDKTPTVEGTLTGVKGQYLILDTGVLNVRKHAGYVVALDLC